MSTALEDYFDIFSTSDGGVYALSRHVLSSRRHLFKRENSDSTVPHCMLTTGPRRICDIHSLCSLRPRQVFCRHCRDHNLGARECFYVYRVVTDPVEIKRVVELVWPTYAETSGISVLANLKRSIKRLLRLATR